MNGCKTFVLTLTMNLGSLKTFQNSFATESLSPPQDTVVETNNPLETSVPEAQASLQSVLFNAGIA